MSLSKPATTAPLSWKVGILAHDGIWGSIVHSVLDIFQSANQTHKTRLFDVEVITPTPTAALLFNGRAMQGDTHIAQSPTYNLIMLSHYWGNFDALLQHYPQVPGWLCAQRQQGAIIAGINSGIFWAAQSGLLEGAKATSYWRTLEEFRQRFPNVMWTDNQSLVEDKGIYSTNGANATNDLILYMVERFFGADIEASLRRSIAFDTRRTYDLTLFNMAGYRKHQDASIHRAQDWLEKNFTGEVEFQALADWLGMSKRTFIRRFQNAIGDKPTRYLQRLRVEAAKQQLLNSNDSIKTICLDVGYRDFGYFSTVFKGVTDLSPRQFRERFRPRTKHQ